MYDATSTKRIRGCKKDRRVKRAFPSFGRERSRQCTHPVAVIGVCTIHHVQPKEKGGIKNFLCRGKRGGRRSHMLREALTSALHKMQEGQAVYPQIPAHRAGILVRFRSAPLQPNLLTLGFGVGAISENDCRERIVDGAPVGATCGRPLGEFSIFAGSGGRAKHAPTE